MVAGTDLASRTQHITTGDLRTDQIPQFSAELKATAFAGGPGLEGFRIKAQIIT